jgi:hypothetical protein
VNSVTETEFIKPDVNWKTYPSLTSAKWWWGGISTNCVIRMVGEGCPQITGKKSGNLIVEDTDQARIVHVRIVITLGVCVKSPADKLKIFRSANNKFFTLISL